MAFLYHHIAASRSEDHAVTDEPELPPEVSFSKGAHIAAELPDPLVFEVSQPAGGTPPHFVGTTIPVFSSLLVDTLRSAGVANFQVFPAVLRDPGANTQWDGYWAFNAIGLIAAADVDKSSADTIVRGGPRGVPVPLLAFHELVLDRHKTRDVAMFRLWESPGTLLVHERVLAHIRKHRPPDGWGFEATGIETV